MASDKWPETCFCVASKPCGKWPETCYSVASWACGKRPETCYSVASKTCDKWPETCYSVASWACGLDWNTPDKWWCITMQLKRFLSFSVHSKDKVTKKDSQRIQQYVWSIAYRWGHKADLKGSLSKLAAKVNKRRRWTHEERKRRGRNAVFHSVFQTHICKLFSPIELNHQWINS